MLPSVEMFSLKSNFEKQKISDEKKRFTVLPIICMDESFDFPLTIISKIKGMRWSAPNIDEEIDLGDIKVQRKNFGKFKDSYISDFTIKNLYL